MNNSVQARIIAIRNKLRAQKVSTSLNYGSLSRPDLTPTAEISSVISQSDHIMDRMLYARFLARFTRTDGIRQTPYVDFAFGYSVEPNLRAQNEALGTTMTGRDVEAWYEICLNGHVAETGTNYVVFAIDVNNNWYTLTNDGAATLNLMVEAISSVAGSLTLERYYD